jgi:hypothetical protein
MPQFGRLFRAPGATLLFLGILVCWTGRTPGAYRLPFLLAGLLLVLAGGWLLAGRKRPAGPPAQDAWKAALRTNGRRLRVNLDDAEIRSNSFREAVEPDASGPVGLYSGLDPLVGRDPVRHRDRSLSRIRIRLAVDGGSEWFYSGLLHQDPVALRFLISGRQTFVYLDPQQPGSYFFDLDFLDA